MDIQHHLRNFLAHPEQAREKGRWARQYLLEHHQPGTYADVIGTICDKLGELRSRHNRLRLAEHVGGAVAPWAAKVLDATLETDYAARIAGMI